MSIVRQSVTHCSGSFDPTFGRASVSLVGWVGLAPHSAQSWQWVTFFDPWPTWPISQLTRDPVPDHGISRSRLLTNHDEFTTVAFCFLQTGILDLVYAVYIYSKSSSLYDNCYKLNTINK